MRYRGSYIVWWIWSKMKGGVSKVVDMKEDDSVKMEEDEGIVSKEVSMKEDDGGVSKVINMKEGDSVMKKEDEGIVIVRK